MQFVKDAQVESGRSRVSLHSQCVAKRTLLGFSDKGFRRRLFEALTGKNYRKMREYFEKDDFDGDVEYLISSANFIPDAFMIQKPGKEITLSPSTSASSQIMTVDRS
jgi:hypothetical protein